MNKHRARACALAFLLLCAGALARENGHVRVTALESILPAKFKPWLDILVQLFVLLFAVFVFRYSLTTLYYSTRSVSTSMRIPMTCVYAAFPVSMAIMAINALFNIVSIFIGRKGSDIDSEEIAE